MKPGADQSQIASCRQPDAEWFGAEQPVGVELGQSREHIDNGDLEAKQVDRARRRRVALERRPEPGVHRPGPMRGQKNEQPTEQANEVIVIQVGGLIDQFHIGETEAEQDGSSAVTKLST